MGRQSRSPERCLSLKRTSHFSRPAPPAAEQHIGCLRILIFKNNVLQCLTMNTLTIRLPEDLKDDLQKLSKEQSKPISDIVRESIRRYVAVEKFRALRKKVLPFAEAQGFLTDEDVFKAIS